MVAILQPDAESQRRLHSHALERLNDWRAELEQKVPQLAELTEAELNADLAKYLGDDEKAKVKEYQDDIVKWLSSCVDIDTSSSFLYAPPYATWVVSPMLNFGRLIKTAYQQSHSWELIRVESHLPVGLSHRQLLSPSVLVMPW